MNYFIVRNIPRNLPACWMAFALTTLIFLGFAHNVFAQKQLSLKEAIAATIQNNRRVKIDSAAMGILQERAGLEKGSLLPKLEFNTQASHYFQQPVVFNTSINTGEIGRIGYIRPGGTDLASTDLSMEISLFNIQQKRKIESALLSGEQYGYKAKATKIDLRAEVKQAYLRVIVLQKKVVLYHTSMRRSIEAFEDSRLLFFRGRATKEDTLRLFLLCKVKEPELLKLQNGIQVGKQLINLLMGVELKKDIILTDSIIYSSHLNITSEEQLFQQAKAGRPAIKILEFDEKIAMENAAAARGSALPMVKLIGQYAIQTQTNSFNFGRGSYPVTSFVGIKMTLPIFTGNAVHFKNGIAILEGRQAKFRQQVAWKVLGADISETLGIIKESSARRDVLLSVSQMAGQNLEGVLLQYQRGKVNKLEVVDALNTASQTESDLIDAGYTFELAMIELERLQGTDVDNL